MRRLIVEFDYTKYLVPLGRESEMVEILGDLTAVTESGGKYLPDQSRNLTESRMTWIPREKLVLSLSDEELALVKEANQKASKALSEKWAAESKVSTLKKEIETLKSMCPVTPKESSDVPTNVVG